MYTFNPNTQETEAGEISTQLNSTQLKQDKHLPWELIGRPWKGAAYWVASLDLLSLLSYRTWDKQPRDGHSHNGLGPPK